MSGGFKWLELGIFQVIADEDGKIIGHIIVDAPNARKCPVNAYVDGKGIGLYLDAAFARAAVEDAMSDRRRSAVSNSGRPSEFSAEDFEGDGSSRGRA